jgi:hypothetical protein
MEPDRPTRPTVELINAHEQPPPNGARVLALGRGGVLVPTTWTSDSLAFFDAWAAYPQVPASVKALQSSRLK